MPIDLALPTLTRGEQAPLVVSLAAAPKPVQRTIARLVQPRKGGVCPACNRPRAKAFAVLAPDTRGARDHSAWRASIEAAIQSVWRRQPPLNGPLRMRITFVLPRPASKPAEPLHTTRTVGGRKQKILNPRRQGGHWVVDDEAWRLGQRVPCPRIPDLDRLVNSLKDSVTACGVWWDDAQVAASIESKWWAALGEEPSIDLRVEQL